MKLDLIKHIAIRIKPMYYLHRNKELQYSHSVIQRVMTSMLSCSRLSKYQSEVKCRLTLTLPVELIFGVAVAHLDWLLKSSDVWREEDAEFNTWGEAGHNNTFTFKQKSPLVAIDIRTLQEPRCKWSDVVKEPQTQQMEENG